MVAGLFLVRKFKCDTMLRITYGCKMYRNAGRVALVEKCLRVCRGAKLAIFISNARSETFSFHSALVCERRKKEVNCKCN